mmetsp:Transcript_1139/g.1453  ORF Transcript_1139/g.1453 Transcript_1139/m.1453 type:complete len:456 (+) Transcript_1139:52-1419(+)
MATLKGKAASAFAKLQTEEEEYLFENLPADISDPLWVDIKGEYSLSSQELGALKNVRCQQAAAAGASQGITPRIEMSQVLLAEQGINLQDMLSADLPFRIPVIDQQWVNRFPQVFELGHAEYEGCIDMWLQRLWTFPSETAVSALDQMWITVITGCISGINVLLNQHDDSSNVRMRPDTSLTLRGALVLKGEAKLLASDMVAAKAQLIDAFFPEAASLFPMHGNVTVGVTTCSTTAAIYVISFSNGRFSANLYRDYSVQTNVADRVRFIVDIFKIMRWIAATTGPASEFHLIPSVRTRTRNGHFVTWTARGILKEFHGRHEGCVEKMLQVYNAHLDHVEWGEAVPGNQNAVLITRVGIQLRDALSRNLITHVAAIEHIRLALEELHRIGLAHCDIVADNVFVDQGVAFLDDLEYITPCDEAAPVTSRWSVAREGHITALQLDNLLFSAFVLEVNR